MALTAESSPTDTITTCEKKCFGGLACLSTVPRPRCLYRQAGFVVAVSLSMSQRCLLFLGELPVCFLDNGLDPWPLMVRESVFVLTFLPRHGEILTFSAFPAA